MGKRVVSIVCALLVVLLATLVLTYRATPSIVVETPAAGETVTSPLVVRGKAKGAWFFEASFPVKLLDALGTERTSVPAQAQSEWMTEDYVPFEVTLPFKVENAQYGTIVFRRDNPSGLPEHDEEFRLAVWLEPSGSPDTMTVKAFFPNRTMQGDECTAVYPVERTIPVSQGVARAALTELLKGVTAEESSRGYHTVLPEGVELRSLTINNGTAVADFSSTLNANTAGSCLVAAIRSQIETTLKQFDTVRNVIVSVEGRTDAILEP